VGGYFDSAGGCWTTRTPAMRAGLKDRSQSAYAAPAPKPVERATGHARPENEFLRNRWWTGRDGRFVNVLRKRMTDATTPTLKPIPLRAEQNKVLLHRRGYEVEGVRDARFY